jgi:predicted HicB family RNase H-like nuclease
MIISLHTEDVPSKKPTVLVRFQPELKAALELAAKEQNRSLSNLVETAMTEWTRQNGYLSQARKKK